MRAFVAVELPDQIQNNIYELQNKLRQCGINLKWVRPENMHLTLVFLGEINESLVPQLAEKLNAIVANHQAFDLEIAGLGEFPNFRVAKVQWVGISEGEEQLCSLQRDIEKCAKGFRIKVDKRKYHPHITLGRCKGAPVRMDLPDDIRDSRVGKIHVDRIHLIKSELGGPQPVYTILRTCKLKPAAKGIDKINDSLEPLNRPKNNS